LSDHVESAVKRIKRRQLLALGAAYALGTALSARAQKAATPVVAILSLEVEQRMAALREGLHALGYVEGRNIRLEERRAGDSATKLQAIAAEYVELKPAVIVAFGNTATEIARKATDSIPIVMVAGVDAVKGKLAASLSRPGGNVTGISTLIQELMPKRLELTLEALPGVGTMGLLWDPNSRSSVTQLDYAQDAAKKFGLRLHPIAIVSTRDFDKPFEALARVGIRVTVVAASSMFTVRRSDLLAAARRHRIGVVTTSAAGAEDGALLSYGHSSTKPYRRAAIHVDKILKGAKAAELPIEQTNDIDLVVNLRTAKALGLTIAHSVLVRADKVIE
jgi:putative tryptophan/tyrosine transport system substrate-binding protein